MGRQSLPSISKLEDVLDLLTDPDKYIKYLKEFRDIYNETLNVLSILDTKEKADKYMSDASDKMKAVVLAEQKSKDKLATLYNDYTQADADLRSALREFDKKVEEDKSSFARREAEILKKYAECQAYVYTKTKELDTKYIEVSLLEKKLEADTKVASILKAKFEKALEE